MKIQLTKKWKRLGNQKISEKYGLQDVLVNHKEAYTEWIYEETVELKGADHRKQEAFLTVEFDGYKCSQGGACLYINGYPVPAGAKLHMPVCMPVKLELKLKVLGATLIQMDRINLCVDQKDNDLTRQLDRKADVLVVTPDYPSAHNLYLCAFVHSRVREYIRAGLNVQVAAIADTWYQIRYEQNGVPVFKGNYYDLKKILEQKTAKAVVVHFVSEEYMQIFDGYVQDEQLIFICHGPETTFDILTDKARPYFTKHIRNEDYRRQFDAKRDLIKKYARKDNVTWIFVSQWLKECSQEVLEIEFLHAQVIHNVINEKWFPYFQKKAQDRKKL